MSHLRNILIIILLWSGFGLSAYGGLPVIDAAAIASQRVSAERDYLEQLLHAAQGEESLRGIATQIVQIDETLKRLGDPAVASQLAGTEELVKFLREGELSKSTEELLKNLSGNEVFTGKNGNATSVTPSIVVDGHVVAPRGEALYRPEAATRRSLLQLDAVRTEVLLKRSELKKQIALNVEQTKAAATTSEVMKLSAVATALHSELASLDKELEFAGLALNQVQETNQLQKDIQLKAQIENQRAAYSISSKRDAETFRLPTKPFLFNR